MLCKKYKKYKLLDKDLGLEYPVFLKAAKDGFYAKNEDKSVSFIKGGDGYLVILLERKAFRMIAYNEYFYFKDYGKKWSIKRKDLE